ncbi:hypothetical protein [Halosegnis longus]|uniref:hypothetical protein n=1 Tax=Halosegnis longus TaxID=2216012 RepID=UPI00129D9AFD|nr:hypothetical protein [Halosegnis longus]
MSQEENNTDNEPPLRTAVYRMRQEKYRMYRELVTLLAKIVVALGAIGYSFSRVAIPI